MRQRTYGFTLVELLIAIVIIAILSSISVAAFNGTQERARDAQRESDISILTKALEMYYIDHGHYPYITGTYYWTSSMTIARYSANTFVPDSWNELQSHLSPYVDKIGSDPKKQLGPSSFDHVGRFGYEYSNDPNAERCNVPRRSGQTYTIYYKKESSAQTHRMSGICTYLAPASEMYSSYTVVKP